jgi:hypothetical protein
MRVKFINFLNCKKILSNQNMLFSLFFVYLYLFFFIVLVTYVPSTYIPFPKRNVVVRCYLGFRLRLQ